MEKRRILVVDDDEMLALALKYNLEVADEFEVEAMSEPLEVLNRARSFRPEVVVMDVMMPGKDGCQILAEMRADEALQRIPVILVSALFRGISQGESSEMASGAEVMLGKPVDRDVLIRCVRERLAANA